jgi:uncharacterized protein
LNESQNQSQTPNIEPQPSPIFFGPDGLRAGWSLLIATLLFLIVISASDAVIRRIHPAHATGNDASPRLIFLSESIAFLIVALVTWIMSRIEGRPVPVYGLGGQHKLRNLITGMFWGVLCLSLLVLMLSKLGLLQFDGRLLFGSDAVRYAFIWIPGFLAIGFFEEYFFRGYLQYTLTRGLTSLAPLLPASIDPQAIGFWAAAILVSFGFGAVHGSNPGESPVGLICAGLASLVFCLSLWRTGSLWWAIGAHAAWDWSQSFLYGVADSGYVARFHLFATHPVGKALLSGGATGPEGSLLVLPILALLAGVILVTQRKNPNSYSANLPPFNRPSPGTGSLPDQAPAPPFEEHHR